MNVNAIAEKYRTQNMHPTNKPPNKNSTSGKAGLSWSKRRNRWRAYVTHNGKTTWVGEFREKETALDAVNACRKAITEDT